MTRRRGTLASRRRRTRPPARPARPPRVPRVHPYRRESPRASVGAASSSADTGEEEWLDAEEGEGELGAGVGDLSDSELAELLDV